MSATFKIMGHSPITKVIKPPIRHLEEYRRLLVRVRVHVEDGDSPMDDWDELLSAAETLVEQCDFLESKLSTKVLTNSSRPPPLGLFLGFRLTFGKTERLIG